LGALSYQEKGTWTAAVSHRWQYSDKHFVGDIEQTYRERGQTQVINDINVVDLSVGYAVNKRINLVLGVPFQWATRSQAVNDTRRKDPKTGLPVPPKGNNDPREFYNPNPEPARKSDDSTLNPTSSLNGAVIDRYETSAYGLSDIKLLGTYWLFDPDEHKDQNISLGLGVLFPTGEKDAKDTFEVYDPASNTIKTERRNVDNSIQPGSGGWGIIFDIYAFKQFYTNFNLYLAGTYIATPETDAGVINGTLTAANPSIWSVNDSFIGRLGVGWTFLPKYGLTFTLGAVSKAHRRKTSLEAVAVVGDLAMRCRSSPAWFS